MLVELFVLMESMVLVELFVIMESMVSVEGLMEPLLEPPSLLSSSNQSIHDSEDVDCWKVP